VATSSIISIPTASYDSFFVNYIAKGGTARRAGVIAGVWSGSFINFNETTTTDIGDTSFFVFNAILTGNNAVLQAQNAAAVDYQIKASISSM